MTRRRSATRRPATAPARRRLAVRARLQGHVSLVGAGPGDPDLMTVRATRRLAEADVVFHDALLSPAMRALAPEARWVFVGKRAGRASAAQPAINRLLVRAARRGQCVVRLKNGDPFVLGRGGEEALALARAGVPCEVIPGVTSATAAAALAGIPVTHRGLASGFVVVSGHAEAAYAPTLAALPTEDVTLIVLMGVHARRAIAASLLGRGFAARTPAALIMGAATPGIWRWTGTLADLSRGAPALPARAADAPGTLVIGRVAALVLGAPDGARARAHSST